MVMPKYKFALLPLAICIASGSVLAATNAELEQRLEDQERQIKKLERKLKGTRGAVKQNKKRISDIGDRFRINGFFSGGVAVNDGDPAELSIYGIEDNYSTDAVSRLGIQMSFEVTDDMSLTGQLVSRGVNNYDIEAEWAYLSWDVTNKFTVRIGRQRIPYYLLSEYLEVGYAYPWVRPPIELYNIPISSTDGLSVLYDFSLGAVNFSTQAYAGAGSGFADQLEGEFTLNQAWGIAQFFEWNDFTFRVGYNTSNLDVGNIQADGVGQSLIDGTEAIATLINGNPALTPTIVASLGPAPMLEPLNLENVSTEYISAAFSYDNGSLLVMGEIANLKVRDLAQPVGDGGYLTIGYRFGDWMPHATYAKFYTDARSDQEVDQLLEQIAYGARTASLTSGLAGLGAIPPLGEIQTATLEAALSSTEGLPALYNRVANLRQQQTSYTLGLTYNINPRVKAKLETTHYENLGEVQQIESVDFVPGVGPTSVITYGEVGGNGRFTGNPGAIEGHTAIYSFSVDAVF